MRRNLLHRIGAYAFSAGAPLGVFLLGDCLANSQPITDTPSYTMTESYDISPEEREKMFQKLFQNMEENIKGPVVLVRGASLSFRSDENYSDGTETNSISIELQPFGNRTNFRYEHEKVEAYEGELTGMEGELYVTMKGFGSPRVAELADHFAGKLRGGTDEEISEKTTYGFDTGSTSFSLTQAESGGKNQFCSIDLKNGSNAASFRSGELGPNPANPSQILHGREASALYNGWQANYRQDDTGLETARLVHGDYSAEWNQSLAGSFAAFDSPVLGLRHEQNPSGRRNFVTRQGIPGVYILSCQ